MRGTEIKVLIVINEQASAHICQIVSSFYFLFFFVSSSRGPQESQARQGSHS